MEECLISVRYPHTSGMTFHVVVRLEDSIYITIFHQYKQDNHWRHVFRTNFFLYNQIQKTSAINF